MQLTGRSNFSSGKHFLNGSGHAARRGEILAVLAALLHTGSRHRFRIYVLRGEHRVKLFERQRIVRADHARILITLDLALFGDARSDENNHSIRDAAS